MKKSRDILQNLRPLFGLWGAAENATDTRNPKERVSSVEEALSKWPKMPRVEWLPVDDTRKVRQAFEHLRESLFDWNRRSKGAWGSPSKMRCESGILQGQRPYFFMQPWNQMGFLFEMTQRGWVIARAERIVSSEQFMRERSAFDHVVLFESSELPGTLRARSDQLGEELTSLSLYEDAVLRLFNDWDRVSKPGNI